MPERPKQLLDPVREAVQRKHYSPRTEESYVGWIKPFILFTINDISTSPQAHSTVAGFASTAGAMQGVMPWWCGTEKLGNAN